MAHLIEFTIGIACLGLSPRCYLAKLFAIQESIVSQHPQCRGESNLFYLNAAEDSSEVTVILISESPESH